MDPRAILSQAIAFHQTGKLADAERLYLQLTVAGEPTAAHMLGVVRAQQGRNDEALELMSAALALRPDAPEILSNYANVLRAQGRFDEAVASYDKALVIKPDYFAAWNKRALALRDLGRLDEA